jgi:hypothetical protein
VSLFLVCGPAGLTSGSGQYLLGHRSEQMPVGSRQVCLIDGVFTSEI